MFLFCVYQGEIDAHEDSFRATDEAGQALLNTGHYASDEVKEKVRLWYHPNCTYCHIVLLYLYLHTTIYHVYKGVSYCFF